LKIYDEESSRWFCRWCRF